MVGERAAQLPSATLSYGGTPRGIGLVIVLSAATATPRNPSGGDHVLLVSDAACHLDTYSDEGASVQAAPIVIGMVFAGLVFAVAAVLAGRRFPTGARPIAFCATLLLSFICLGVVAHNAVAGTGADHAVLAWMVDHRHGSLTSVAVFGLIVAVLDAGALGLMGSRYQSCGACCRSSRTTSRRSAPRPRPDSAGVAAPFAI